MLIVTFAVLVYSFNNQMNTLLWNSSNTTDNVVLQCLCLSGGGGGSPIHYLYGYVQPNGVVILKLLILKGVSISEAFSRTGYNISNARKLQFCKQLFEIIQGQIAFKNTVRYGCTLVAPCVLEYRAGVFWREPRALTPPSWINRGAEVWNESIMYPREMETSSKERDGGGELEENR